MSVRPDLELTRVLRALFIAQARDVAVRTTPNSEPPDMAKWLPVMSQAVRPYLLQLHRQGMLDAAKRITRLQREGKRESKISPQTVGDRAEAESEAIRRTAIGVGTGDDKVRAGTYSIYENGSKVEVGSSTRNEPIANWHPEHHPERKGIRVFRDPFVDFTKHQYRRKSLRRFYAKALGWDFDLYNPRVDEAVDNAVFAFCSSTLSTTTMQLDDALTQLRIEMKEGLSRGEAKRTLAQRVYGIFAEPARAWRIAVTESSRAIHGGGVLAMRESGIVEKRRWVASIDACSLCQILDMKEVGLDEPYYINPKGGPYAVVLYPPAHPFLFLHRKSRIRVIDRCSINQNVNPILLLSYLMRCWRVLVSVAVRMLVAVWWNHCLR